MAGKPTKSLPPNHQAIRAAKALNDAQTEYAITGQRGLKLLVMPSGVAAFVFRYDYRLGTKRLQRKVTLGNRDAMDFGTAKRRADELRRAVESGADPVNDAKQRATAMTLRELFADRKAKDDRRAETTLADYEKVLERDVFPELGDIPAGEISADTLARVLSVVEERSVHTAHRARSALGSTYRWGLRKRLVKDNPCSGLGFTAKSKPRTRVPQDDELEALWNGMDHPSAAISDAMKTIARLAILTGQRRGEVTGMRVSELSALDTDKPRWLIPAARMKRKDRDQLVPLSRQAAALIQTAIENAAGGCVFPADRGRMAQGAQPRTPHIHPESVSRAIGRLGDVLSNVERQKQHDDPDHTALDLSGLVIHDMRKAVATWLRENGFGSDVVDLILHHAPRGVTGSHYDFARLEAPVRIALQAWADHISTVTKRVQCQRHGNVVDGTSRP